MIKERVIAGMHTPFPQQSTLSFVISTGAKRSGEICFLLLPMRPAAARHQALKALFFSATNGNGRLRP